MEKKKIENRKECISYEDFLSQLADQLSFNYVSVSFGETHKDGLIHGIDKPRDIYENIFSDFHNPVKNRGGDSKCRNVLVVGSGATHDAYAALPLGFATKNLLGEKLNLQSLLETNHSFRDRFEDEAKRIISLRLGKVPDLKEGSMIFHPKFDFESYLLLMTKFFREQDVRKALQEMFNVRYAPCLFYEIAAHLFKHRFFDVIINFNFDELLDQSIREEMGVADYHQIISDGDCKSISDLIVDGRLKIPVYIKPHGTISHKSSLRFTKDHYFDLPDDIKDLLNQMFQGELADQTKPIDLINVLTVGFNLDSIEFNEILKKNKEKIRLYSITYDEKPEFYLSEDTQDKGELYKDKDGKYRLLPTKFGRGPDDDISVTLGDVFHDLFKQVNQRFKDPYLPRGITRHLIFTKAFYREEFRKKGENETPLKSYEEIEDHYSTSSFFKSRSVLELAIALAGGRGKIELKELMTDRLGEVYRLYRKYHEKEKQKGLPDSLYDMAEIFQLKEEISFSRNVHNISEISDREKKEFQDEYLNLFGPENDAAIRELDYAKRIIFRLLTAKQTPEMLRDAFVDKHNKEELDLAIIHEMAGYFQNIYQTGYYQDVNAKFSDSRLYIFDHYFKDQILHTSLSYSYRFNEVFLDTDHWDYLFFISDTGSILERLAPFLEKEGALQNKKIYLITCAEAIKKDTGHYKPINQIVEERTNDLFEYPQLRDNIIHRTLPYSDHHHHISIFLKKVPKDKPIYELSRFPTIQIVSSDGTFENYIFSRSIYFYQKGFHSEINPIWVRGAFAFLKNENTPLPSNFATNLLVKDHIMLLETFYAYHRKAKAFCGTDGQSIEYLLPKHFDLGENPSKELYDRRFDISEVFNLP